MKQSVFIMIPMILMSFVGTAFAETTILKRCRYSGVSLDGSFKNRTMHSTITALDTNGELYGLITTRSDNGEIVQNEIMTPLNIDTYSVRKGLSANSFENATLLSTLNLGEKLIAHAFYVEAEPHLKNLFSSGLKLSEVRQVRAYLFGDTVGLGMSALLEAYDQNHKLMGSFVGGLLVMACQ